MQLFRALTAHNEECGACRVSGALNGDREDKEKKTEEKKIRKRRRYIRSEEGRIS